MLDYVSPLLQWLNANPQWSGLVIFAISAGESAPIFGTLVPGSITMTAFGALAGAGVIPLWGTIFWAILGAIVGDGIGYWIGHYFKATLHRCWPFKQNPEILLKGEVFVSKYGSMSVFIGRFVGPVRALVPLVAGMLGMKPLQFTIANITSAIGWAPAYMLPGILLGAMSLELPPEIALHVILVLLVIFLFILMCLWIIYKLAMLIRNQVIQLQNWLWRGMKKRPYFSSITVLLKRAGPDQTCGQINLALFFLSTSALFLCLLWYVHWAGPAHIRMNEVVFHLFRGIRTSNTVDNVMISLTLLGQKQVIFPVFLALFAWLILRKRWRAAFHTLALGIISAGSIFAIKHIVQSPRPWGILENPEAYSMPSGHTTLAAVVFMGLAFLVANAIRPKYRWPIYTLAVLLSMIVGISRLYLGAHWFTDVLGGWLLSTMLLSLVIISYQREIEKPLNPIGTALVSLTTLSIMLIFFHYQFFTPFKMIYAPINPPASEISMNEWWGKNAALPTYRTSFFGFPSEPINIEWSGDFEDIRNKLLADGWSKPPARDLISTFHRIADISSTQYLPLVSPQYLDKKPILILTRQTDDDTMLVLRLWDTHLKINRPTADLWVGIVGAVPRSYSWLFKKNRRLHLDIAPTLIFPDKKNQIEWEWKIIEASIGSNHPTKQSILMLRKKKS